VGQGAVRRNMLAVRMTLPSFLAMLALAGYNGGCNNGSNNGSSSGLSPGTALSTAPGATQNAASVVPSAASSSATRNWVCKNPPATGLNSLACGHCVERECPAALSSLLSSCPVYLSCVEACECSDRACLIACAPKVDATCRAGSIDTETCKKAHCAGPDTCDVKH
jgi:hypothetical protein